MNWRTTWLITGIAAALFAFIFLYERHIGPSDIVPTPQPLLGGFKASSATAIQLRKGNIVLALEQTNGGWRYTAPVAYPAASLAIKALLETFDQTIPASYITPQEIVARKQTVADFGLDVPAIVLTLQSGSERHDVRFGSRTPANDQVYVEVGRPGIYVVSASILERLPRTQNDWRDTTLIYLPEPGIDRLEINRVTGGFALQRDITNRIWRLTQPAHRADQFRVGAMVRQLLQTRITSFVSDDPRAELENFGLQTPQAELTIGAVAQTQKLLFGRSPTNDPTQVYARQVSATNIVLVPRTMFDLVYGTQYAELRDRRLIDIAPDIVDAIDIAAEENFSVKRQPNGVWAVADTAVDSEFVNVWIGDLSRMEVTKFVKDVVTDFTEYGLNTPRARLTLRTTVTNGATMTNVPVAQLDIGTNDTPETVFVRRGDEASVYTVHVLNLLRIPTAAWQLRDHRVNSFSTNQVVRVAVRQDNRTRQLIRASSGTWASTTGEAEHLAMDELMYRLGELRAIAWVGRGDVALRRHGFTPQSYQLTIDYKEGDKMRAASLQFGGKTPLGLPCAAATIEGQPWIFVFDWTLYADLLRYLSVSPAGAGL